MNLVTAPNLPDPDDAYAMLLEAHRDLTPDQARTLDTDLVLILANHIGDPQVLREALELARRSAGR